MCGCIKYLSTEPYFRMRLTGLVKVPESRLGGGGKRSLETLGSKLSECIVQIVNSQTKLTHLLPKRIKIIVPLTPVSNHSVLSDPFITDFCE